jgi:hypothetical protein
VGVTGVLQLQQQMMLAVMLLCRDTCLCAGVQQWGAVPGAATYVVLYQIHNCCCCLLFWFAACNDCVQEFSDWAQCQVLELVAHYTPASDAEVRQQQQQCGWQQQQQQQQCGWLE